MINTSYKITACEDAHPVCIHTPWKSTHPLIPKVKTELENMEKQGVSSPVTEQTSWCSGIVVVLKPNGSIRICVDLTHLNKAVQREVHPMLRLAKLGQSKNFS